MSDLRYTVGHKYAFARVSFNDKDVFVRPFNPNKHDGCSIDVVLLTCEAHYRVPVDYREEEGPKADGFTFMQDGGQQWRNQYPKAHYQQMDDSNDRRVMRQVMRGQVMTDDHMVAYDDAFHMLASVYNILHGRESFRDRIGGLDSNKRLIMQSHFDLFLSKVSEAIGGKTIVFKELAFDMEGETKTLAGYYEATLA